MSPYQEDAQPYFNSIKYPVPDSVPKPLDSKMSTWPPKNYYDIYMEEMAAKITTKDRQIRTESSQLLMEVTAVDWE